MKYFFWGFLFFAVAYLVPIAGRPLHRPDEFRYAEIPREMIESGDFVTPRLLGAPYFEKPVLGYWLVAASLKVFGENRFAARLPMAVAAGLTALLLALWIKRVSGDREWALWAAFFYLATGLGWLMGTTAVLDGILCLFTTATLLCVHQAVTTEKWNWERLIWLVLSGVTAGLGFMTKGFVAWAAPGSAIVAWLLWTRRWKAFLWLPWIPLAALAATVAPWALEIHRAEPDFWCQFVVVEHLLRLSPKPDFWQRFVDLGDLKNFKPDSKALHPQPFWYFVPILLGTIFPAAFTVLPGAAAGRELWKKVWRNGAWRFALCGFLLPFCFFSASEGKLATYILPCFPFASALLVYPALEALRAGRRGAQLTLKWSFDILGWLFMVAGAAAVAFGLALLPPAELRRFIPVLKEAAPFFILYGIVVAVGGFLLIRYRRAQLRRIAVFFGAFALTAAVSAAIPESISDKMPERDLLALANSGEFDPRTAHIFTYGQMGHSVAWTFRRSDTRLLFSAGEQDYGAERARKDGRLLLWGYGRNGEFTRLVRDPARRREVIYVATTMEDQRGRYKLLENLKPRRADRGNMIVLIFDPPVTSPAPPPAPPAR